MRRYLTPNEARAFYDRFGAKQDQQGWYEDAALAELVEALHLAEAHRVYELGCGTGRLAARLLAERLPADAEYVAVDLSVTMCALATERLAPYAPRARVFAPDALPPEFAAAGRYDRYLSTYVMDLLPPEGITAALAEAHRLLAPGGRLGVVSLTPGEGLWRRVVAGAWSGVHAMRPQWVGGCRPIRLVDFLPATAWRIEHRAERAAFGVASEVIVAQPLQPGDVPPPPSGGRR